MNPPTIVLESGEQVAVVHLVHQIRTERQMPDGLMVPVVDWRIACTPGLQDLHGTMQRLEPWQRSEDVRAVTCPMCQQTVAYRGMVIPDEKRFLDSKPAEVQEAGVQIHLAVREKLYWRTACGTGEGKQRSEDVRAVTCVLCKESDEYRMAKKQLKKVLEQAWA